MSARALVISDTHLRPDTIDRLPDQVWREAAVAAVILHAGDVVCAELLEALASVAPVCAVLGNNDVGVVDLPTVAEMEIGGVDVAVIHDSGPRKGRERRMHKRFPEAEVVVFGHSHEPLEAMTEYDQLLFNPGSPTQRRRQPQCSYGVLVIGEGRVESSVVLLE